MLRTILTALLIVILTYFGLVFAQWEFNPARWSFLSRSILVMFFVLSFLKPFVDAIAAKRARAADDYVEQRKARRDELFDGQ